MAKDKLNNLLSFKEFSEFPQNTKSTKRTEIGGDVINENVFDKIKQRSKMGKEYEDLLGTFVSKIKNVCKAGQVQDIKINGDTCSFVHNTRKFTVNKEAGTLIMYEVAYEKREDPKTKKKKNYALPEKREISIKISKEIAEEVYNTVKACK